jgi:hypothetical protein
MTDAVALGILSYLIYYHSPPRQSTIDKRRDPEPSYSRYERCPAVSCKYMNMLIVHELCHLMQAMVALSTQGGCGRHDTLRRPA